MRPRNHRCPVILPHARVTRSDDADQLVAELGRASHFRPEGVFYHAGFDIDAAITQRRAVLVRLLTMISSLI
ncbi:hypothetical protein HJO_14917 [Hyphomonas johnsonii MHS-2]|uniref:Uncharacterized protein n=1 Tax=Hyphomonas johnsonii MHS-2 TaxID=1280950 RepID=A0A059FFY3_9PROT|nr:hypothetical protein HJO_14917 [Hyphomonas johnsonii MHS-2]